MLNNIKILKSTFVKNFLLTSGGMGVSIVINFLLQPVITRLYLPETIGVFSLIVSIVTVLNITSSLSYDKAILAANDKKEAISLFYLSTIILVGFLVLILIVLFFGFDLFFQGTKYEAIKSFYLLIPLFIFFKGFNKNLQYLLIKVGSYSKNSISEILKGTIPSSFKILFGWILSSKVLYLIIASLIGALFNSVYLLTQSFKIIIVELTYNDYDKLKQVYKKYIEYLKYFNWNNLLNSFAQQIIFFLLITFYSTKEIGYYSLAYGVVLLPLGLVSDSVYKVFLPHLSKKINDNELIGSGFKKVTLYLMVIGSVGFLILFLIAPWLFEFVFGDAWRQSGVYARCLIPWMFMLFINKPANSVIQSFQKFKFLTVYNLIVLALRVLSVSLGYFIYESVIVSLFLFAMVGFLGNLVFVLYSYVLVLNHDKKIHTEA